MAGSFEVIEHTADTGIVASGPSIEEAFANAARGMFSIMSDIAEVRETEARRISVEASDQELLLAEWLSELLFIFETEQMVFGRFEIELLTSRQLLATAWGERIDPDRHRIGTGIKAVTHHMLKLEQSDGYRATVIFDV